MTAAIDELRVKEQATRERRKIDTKKVTNNLFSVEKIKHIFRARVKPLARSNNEISNNEISSKLNFLSSNDPC